MSKTAKRGVYVRKLAADHTEIVKNDLAKSFRYF